MKLKPNKAIRIDRIEIKLVEYQGSNYLQSKTISVYDITINELYDKIIGMIKEAEK